MHQHMQRSSGGRAAPDAQRGAMPGRDERVQHADRGDLWRGAAGVSGDCAADAGDFGAGETSFLVHGRDADSPAAAYDSAVYEFFLEREAGWNGSGARQADSGAWCFRGSTGWSEGSEERGILCGGEDDDLFRLTFAWCSVRVR